MHSKNLILCLMSSLILTACASVDEPAVNPPTLVNPPMVDSATTTVVTEPKEDKFGDFLNKLDAIASATERYKGSSSKKEPEKKSNIAETKETKSSSAADNSQLDKLAKDLQDKSDRQQRAYTTNQAEFEVKKSELISEYRSGKISQRTFEMRMNALVNNVTRKNLMSL